MFSSLVAVLSLVVALLLAVMADRHQRGVQVYRTLLIWPYAVAPAVAGVLWFFMFQPSLGMLARALRVLGIDWNPLLNGDPRDDPGGHRRGVEADSLQFPVLPGRPAGDPEKRDRGGGDRWRRPMRRFWTIVFPLLSPTTFFLIVVNIVYAFFDTFGIIDTMTGGGPARATRPGLQGLCRRTARRRSRRLGRAIGDPDGHRDRADRIQFRYVERKVNY